MRKNFGKNTWLYPMPVLIIGTFDSNNTPNAMNAAWGGIYDTNKIMVCLSDDHKTTFNIKEKKAFTINIADAKHVKECDYVGIVSGNKVSNKFEKAGFTYEKSEFVDAPIINELPMCLECKLDRINDEGIVIGDIININAKEEVLGEDGKIDYQKVEAITYEPVHHYYVKLGEKVGNAFSDGKKIK